MDSVVYGLLLSEPNEKEKPDGEVLTWHQNVGQFEILDPEPPLTFKWNLMSKLLNISNNNMFKEFYSLQLTTCMK